MDRIMPGVIAVLFGMFVLAVVFVPLVALSYRRRGGFSGARMLGWIALLFVLMGLWAYTLLPLPDGNDFACVGIVVNPFEDVADIWRLQAEHGGSLLANAAVQQLVLNVLLFMPLGALVRLLFDRGVVVAAVVGALGSLAIELTQLTGVWGLFHCAYRVFDTGDLVSNTLGAALGSLAALALVRHRDSPAARAEATPELSEAGVSAWRRVLAMVADLIALWLISGGVAVVVNLAVLVTLGRDAVLEVSTTVASAATVIAISVQAASVLVGGVTVGERAVLIAATERRRPRWLWRTVRLLAGIGGYGVLSLLPSPWAIAATVLVIASLVAAFTTRGHRGLAQAAAGMDTAVRVRSRDAAKTDAPAGRP